MVGVKSYRAIKQLKDLIKKRPDITFFMFEIINQPLNGFKMFNYHKNIVSEDTLINTLINLNVVEISAWILDEPNEPDEYFIYINNYIDKDISASVIQQSWKKCKFNVFKKRRDPLKQELMAYCWNPFRLNFQID